MMAGNSVDTDFVRTVMRKKNSKRSSFRSSYNTLSLEARRILSYYNYQDKSIGVL